MDEANYSVGILISKRGSSPVPLSHIETFTFTFTFTSPPAQAACYLPATSLLLLCSTTLGSHFLTISATKTLYLSQRTNPRPTISAQTNLSPSGIATMPEGGEASQPSTQAQGQPGRGNRRRRAGRGRGRGNGSENATTEGGSAPQPQSSNQQNPQTTTRPGQTDASSSAPGTSRRPRRRRPARGGGQGQGGRGGASEAQVQPRTSFRVGSQRQFGGRLTTEADNASQADTEAGPSLSATAAEFVPGQPVETRRYAPCSP